MNKLQNHSNTGCAILPVVEPFYYTGSQRHIILRQIYFNNQAQSQSLYYSYLLDPELSIIKKEKDVQIDLNSQLQKNSIKQEDNIKYYIVEQKKEHIFVKNYQKYYQLNDFIFGRQSWGRQINCLRIANDQISREHSKITYKNNHLIQNQERQRRMKQILDEITRQSHYSSNLRKICPSLWDKISEYTHQPPKYVIRDCGSRNGTFLRDQSLTETQLLIGWTYQFEKEQYQIQIKEIRKAQSVSLQSVYEQFLQSPEQNCYNKRNCIKSIITPVGVALQDIKEYVSIILLEINYISGLKYLFWVVATKNQQSYSIGEGQQISIASSIERRNHETIQHGSIAFQQSKWIIKPICKEQRIWLKFPVGQQYQLLTKNKYRIRLGHSNIIDLRFYNFD